MAIRKHIYTFKIVEDCEIRADVYRTNTNVIQPAIVWIHGGALIMGSRGNIDAGQLDRYVSSGLTLVSIDYRLAPETKLQGIVGDVQDAFEWVREEGPALFLIDPDRIAAVGHSAGGYLTLMAGVCVSPRPKALVSFYGYGDITGTWYTRPDPFYCQQPLVPKEEAYKVYSGRLISEDVGQPGRERFYLYCRQNGLWPSEVVGHDPDMEPEVFGRFCPVRNLTKDFPPTMLLHGDKDTDVPYDQSVIMAKQLSRQGVEYELITIPGGEHGFDDDTNNPKVAYAFDRVMAFLSNKLG